ncbi:MAG TPA: DegV family protein, partial [Treponemataceae bacterium]|nr:DegV family protein [Treponemataceae bacterium]
YPIQVIDTRLNSVAQGLVVLGTARAAAGAGFDELVRIAERARERTKIYVGVNTFKYMVRGGRVSRLKGLVATAPDRATDFAERLEGIVGKPPEYIMEISPIVGSHAGKGALAVAVETR